MTISKNIQQLSTSGIINILNGHSHVTLWEDESRDELEQILQINVNDYLIDEVEIILELSGE